MVATWVVEPSNSLHLEPQRVMSLAEQFAILNRRISRVVEIMAEPAERDGGDVEDKPDVYQLRDLFDGFRQQKDRILHDSVLSDTGKVKKL